MAEAAGVTIRVSGGKNTVAATAGMTVANALATAGVKPVWRAKLFLNDQPARTSDAVKDGDTVTVSPRIRNG